MKRPIPLFAFFVLITVCSQLKAQQPSGHFQIPDTISYQGFLSNADTAFNGTTTASLFLYNDPSSGTFVWSEPYNSVPVNKGYYTLLMDLSQHWTNGVGNFDRPYWLEVHIKDSVMNPRIQLTASPYAMTAKIADSALHVPSQSPVGTIIAYALDRPTPQQEKDMGWFVCDGRPISPTDYPDYANLATNIYGSDANGVFLPDLQGEFLRGVNDGRDTTIGDAGIGTRKSARLGGNPTGVGSTELDAFQSHTHNLHTGSGTFTRVATGPADGSPETAFIDTPFGYKAGATTSVGNSTETRPRNVAVYWLIKVR